MGKPQDRENNIIFHQRVRSDESKPDLSDNDVKSIRENGFKVKDFKSLITDNISKVSKDKDDINTTHNIKMVSVVAFNDISGIKKERTYSNFANSNMNMSQERDRDRSSSKPQSSSFIIKKGVNNSSIKGKAKRDNTNMNNTEMTITSVVDNSTITNNCETCVQLKKRVIKLSKDKMDLSLELGGLKKESKFRYEEYEKMDRKLNEKLKQSDKDSEYILKQEKEITRLTKIIDKLYMTNSISMAKESTTANATKNIIKASISNDNSHTMKKFNDEGLYNDKQNFIINDHQEPSMNDYEQSEELVIKDCDVNDYFKVNK